MILTFMLFALLPLGLFAVTSYLRVRDEILASSNGRTRADATSIGVIVTERLMLAADELLRHADERGDEGVIGIGHLARPATLVEIEELPQGTSFDETVRASLAKSGVAVQFRELPERSSLWLIATGRRTGRLVAARVDSDFLFNPDGLIRVGNRHSIHRRDGTLIHSSSSIAPSAESLVRSGLGTSPRGDLRWTERGDERIGQYWEVFTQPRFGVNLVVAVHGSRRDLFSPLDSFGDDFLLAVLLTIACVLFASLVRIRRIMRPVGSLVEATERIARNDLGARVAARGNDEFSALGRAFNAMAADLENRQSVMVEINEFGKALSVESDAERLVARLVTHSAGLFGADGVLVYLLGDSAMLEFKHLQIGSLDLELRRPPPHARRFATVEPDAVGAVPLKLDGSDRDRHVIARALAASAQDTDYDLRSLLVLPMLDHDGDVVGAMSLFNPTDADGNPITFADDVVKLAQSLAGQATIAVRNTRLRHEFKALFDAMIEIMAVAVDEKSPYTGGHCRRVPEIAMMLLDEVDRTDQGPLAGVSFDAHQVYEMQVAALLHDCGKVVTPVHVVDKATKLETIYDRIHLIDQRFALVAREAEIRELRSVAEAAGVDLSMAEERIATTVDRLRAEQSFIRGANTGGEFMAPASIERVESIASARNWRDLDGDAHPFLSDEEVTNLSVQKGTLNEREREIINYHMDATIKMLEQLPFPKRMRMVPSIAGSHHERIDGKGYPKGLSGTAFPLQGRILAVADVFEALTAADRPYKKGKTLTEALKLMAFMACDGHLDPDVYATFVDSRVWERYAETKLSNEQRDDVDLDEIHRIFDPARTVEGNPAVPYAEGVPASDRL